MDCFRHQTDRRQGVVEFVGRKLVTLEIEKERENLVQNLFRQFGRHVERNIGMLADFCR